MKILCLPDLVFRLYAQIKVLFVSVIVMSSTFYFCGDQKDIVFRGGLLEVCREGYLTKDYWSCHGKGVRSV